MNYFKKYSNYLLMSTLFAFTLFAAGCGSSDTNTTAPEYTPKPITFAVESTVPVDGDMNASLNGKIAAFFTKELDGSTVDGTTFTLTDTNTSSPVDGNVTNINNAMLFTPTADLNVSHEYNATITGMKDLAGNTLAADYVWSFQTGDSNDSTAPTVMSTGPEDNATAVPINTGVSAVFSEAFDPTTVTFTLKNGTTPVTGTLSYTSNTMIFTPTTDLNISTDYTATITTSVTDLAGISLASDKVWSFTTGTTTTVALAPVNLGTAGDFVALAKSKIAATTPASIAIIGNIGLSPAALSYITGFSETLSPDGTYATSDLVTGKIYAAAMTAPTPTKMTTAVSDMETAYTDAAGRTTPDFTELGAGDVSGMTLAPGLYKWGTDLLITNADVTISGSATDVWIFQISGDLTLQNDAIVHLAGGALAKNIFWQVAGGSGVILGTNTTFKGVALAQKAIVVNSGSTVNGRLLAQSAVTLDASSVTKP